MKVIVPMAGLGQRFVDAGYEHPKPMIEVGGKPIIDRIVDMFDPKDFLIFICNERHLEETGIRDYLYDLHPNSYVVDVPEHNEGPVFTTLPYMDMIEDDEPVIVTYCDNPYLWDYKKFKKWVKENEVDGCILTHSDFHPHRLASTYMAYCKTKKDGSLIEIKEKEPYTKNHMKEHASTGTYYFKKGSYIKKYFQDAIDNKIKHSNGEYYVTLVYNLLVKDKLDVKVYDTDHVMVFGTPSEVENFEAWNTILDGSQVKSEKDLVKCYNYWKEFRNVTSNT